jgi:hypothetical protein
VTLPYLPGRSTTGLYSQVRAAEPLPASIPSTLRRSS